jgi:small GTP-binding protein
MPIYPAASFDFRTLEADGGLLRELGRIIDRHGFIEFRASLSQLVEKIETPTYEIAFFGRVSAGKSSLLNRIIGVDLLPTGVTPITAVPTRIRHGARSELLVWTAEGKPAEYGIERLADFVTERKNPGNEKHVTRLFVAMPLPMLPNEVVLVDTPGLGSLALEGATETLAYLPSCDLGVVLVDASSNLHSDDVATVDTLRAASVPVLVVLSKVDLLTEEDRGQLLDYTRTQLAHQLGTEVQVTPLSTRPELAGLLEEWIKNQIAPRAANAQRLSRESIQRKTRSLAQRVFHALEISAKASTIPPAEGRQPV